jgi:hypothetical protein
MGSINHSVSDYPEFFHQNKIFTLNSYTIKIYDKQSINGCNSHDSKEYFSIKVFNFKIVSFQACIWRQKTCIFLGLRERNVTEKRNFLFLANRSRQLSCSEE